MADAWGVEDRWTDVGGQEHEVSEASIEHLRGLIGEPDTGPAPVVVTRPGDRPDLGPGDLRLEDGTAIGVDGPLPPDLPLGYHRFQGGGPPVEVISAPATCHLPPGERMWGWAAQLYATRSEASWGLGDLGDLARLTAWSQRLGAGFVLINPIGATVPVGAQNPSPYFPSTRRFRNPIYVRVEAVPGAEMVPDVVAAAAAAGRDLDRRRTIDRDAVWQLKSGALEAIWAGRPDLDRFERWLPTQPDSLWQYAAWCVLVETHGGDWRAWPGDCRTPAGPGVAGTVGRDPRRVRYHAWLQWLLETQLGAAAAATPVMQDLPIGVDPGGFDAWSWQDVLALGASVGAPPDEFNRRGQDWGLPPFVPWRLRAAGYRPIVETIRAGIAGGGGIRIDHVMGLFRQWWIPRGGEATAGAYVRYPADDLLAIVALESRRAGAVVVGEDLGTVEDSARRALDEHDILSYRLLWFEPGDPAWWPAKAMAAVTTHDLPTVAGLWDRSDIEEQRRLGLDVAEDSTEAIRARLAGAAGLAADAGPADVVVATYGLLGRAPAVRLCATLEDAVGEPARPNLPGTVEPARANWSLALPETLERIETDPLATRLAARLEAAVRPPAEPSEGAPHD